VSLHGTAKGKLALKDKTTTAKRSFGSFFVFARFAIHPQEKMVNGSLKSKL
jgi:hypothetical protein